MWLCWKIFHYEMIFLLVDSSCLIWGCKKLEQKAFFGCRSHFFCKKVPKLAKIGKVDLFLHIGVNFLGLWIFFTRFFLAKQPCELPGHPLGYLCTNFHQPGIIRSHFHRGAFDAPPLKAAKEFPMPYWIGLRDYLEPLFWLSILPFIYKIIMTIWFKLCHQVK